MTGESTSAASAARGEGYGSRRIDAPAGPGEDGPEGRAALDYPAGRRPQTTDGKPSNPEGAEPWLRQDDAAAAHGPEEVAEPEAHERVLPLLVAEGGGLPAVVVAGEEDRRVGERGQPLGEAPVHLGGVPARQGGPPAGPG